MSTAGYFARGVGCSGTTSVDFGLYSRMPRSWAASAPPTASVAMAIAAGQCPRYRRDGIEEDESAAAKPISRILSAFVRQQPERYTRTPADYGATIIPLALSSLTGSSDLPGGFGRAVLERLPIWSCSVRGCACHRPYGRRGALLPHLFTLTHRSPKGEGGRYIFCATGPSGYPARALPGALPSGVRTFLPRPHFAGAV